MPVAELLAPTEPACAHCSLPVPSGLLRDGEVRQFCCAGCRTAFEILHEHGLERYYALGERRDRPVRSTGRTYEEFDHPKFAELYVHPLPDGLCEVELYLDGVHCGSCVWLVERVPLVVTGVVRAELEVRRSLARVTWDPASVPLSQVARTLDSLGYPPHPFRAAKRDELRRREDRAMLARIGVAGAIAINVMLAALALYSGQLGGMEAEFERYFRWVSLVVTTPAMIWPARVFFSGAWAALRARTLHMDVPIAIGLAAGYLRGAVNTVQDAGPIYFDGLATLIFALLVGRYLQQRGQRAAADGAELLYSLTPTSARVVADDGVLHDVPAEALVPGMVLDVRAGESFAADGVVSRGSSRVDASLLTGESRPVAASEGTRVFAGTLNVSAPLRVRIEQTGEASRVARIMRQVDESAARRAPVVESANRIAAWFVLAVLVLAAGTFVAWQWVDPSQAADHAIALLIVTCPCALALSTPLAVSTAVGRAARAGIFVKGGDVIERLSRAGSLLLDKTGTITEAKTALVQWDGSDWAKPLVVALERGSSHPIAAAFVNAWPEGDVLPVERSQHVAGGGIAGRVAGREVIVGSPRFVRDRIAAQGAADALVARDAAEADPSAGLADGALTPVVVAVDGVIVGTARIGDPVRADAAQAVGALVSRGWDVSILSGDAPAAVAHAGTIVGVPPAQCRGGASPEDKLHRVERALASSGDRPVVMVGDGINDAAAIAAASVGIGVHGGAEACLQTADVYLAQPGLAALVDLMDGSRRTMRVIRRNILFSIVYNAVGATLAMLGILTPLIAAILMPASSLTVVLSSWRSHTFGAPEER